MSELNPEYYIPSSLLLAKLNRPRLQAFTTVPEDPFYGIGIELKRPYSTDILESGTNIFITISPDNNKLYGYSTAAVNWSSIDAQLSADDPYIVSGNVALIYSSAEKKVYGFNVKKCEWQSIENIELDPAFPMLAGSGAGVVMKGKTLYGFSPYNDESFTKLDILNEINSSMIVEAVGNIVLVIDPENNFIYSFNAFNELWIKPAALLDTSPNYAISSNVAAVTVPLDNKICCFSAFKNNAYTISTSVESTDDVYASGNVAIVISGSHKTIAAYSADMHSHSIESSITDFTGLSLELGEIRGMNNM